MKAIIFNSVQCVITHPYLVPRLKKEYSYTSASLFCPSWLVIVGDLPLSNNLYLRVADAQISELRVPVLLNP